METDMGGETMCWFIRFWAFQKFGVMFVGGPYTKKYHVLGSF